MNRLRLSNYLYFLIPEVIAKLFVPTAELVISTGTQTDEENEKNETQPVIVDAKISKCLYNLIYFSLIK